MNLFARSDGLKSHHKLAVAGMLAILVLLFTTACASPPRSSYGPAARPVKQLVLVVENANDSEIEVTQYSKASERLRVTEAEKDGARSKIGQLNQIFERGMRDVLPRSAATRGLTLVPSPNRGSGDRMVVRALTRKYECRLGCMATFDVRVDVYDEAGNTIWWAWRPFGQSSPADEIGARTFARFIDEMLDLMKREKLLAGS